MTIHNKQFKQIIITRKVIQNGLFMEPNTSYVTRIFIAS